MNAGIGSSKLRNATTRMNREKEFLHSITVQADDMEALEQKLQAKPSVLRVLKAIRDQVVDAATVRFVIGERVVSQEEIAESRRIFNECKATVQKFGGEV